MARRRGLGRGLDALLGGAEGLSALEPGEAGELREIAIERITRGRYQPRSHFPEEGLRELAESIRAQGVVQPVLVRAHGQSFELVAGERRWRAAQLAGLATIPAIVRDLDDQASAAIGLIENIQREELNALEEAHALQRLTGEFGLTHQQTADAVGRSRVAVSNLLRLLELHDEVKDLLREGRLEMGHARALLAAPPARQPALARAVVARGLSVRQTEALVRGPAPVRRPARGSSRDPDIRALEQRLGERLGARVGLSHNRDGRGKLTISYNSLEELEGILAHLRLND